MSFKLFREVYGYDASEQFPARRERQIETKSNTEITAVECPFIRHGCWKKSQAASIGVCGGSTPVKGEPVITCPKRFHVDAVWNDLEEYFFEDSDNDVDVMTEADMGEPGNVDLLVAEHDDGDVNDFVPVEIQASYFTGDGVKNDFDSYMEDANAGRTPSMPNEGRSMDHRSCVDKRLAPQLLTKASTAISWGKSFAIVVQDVSFENSSILQQTEEADPEEANLYWFSYEYIEDSPHYRLERNEDVYLTTLEEVIAAFDRIPSKDSGEFTEYASRKVSKHIDPDDRYVFLYNDADDYWGPEKLRLTNLPGIAERTARKFATRVTVVEDLLEVGSEVQTTVEGGEVEVPDVGGYELADFVEEAVGSRYHDDLLEELKAYVSEAEENREDGEVERARGMDDWLTPR